MPRSAAVSAGRSFPKGVTNSGPGTRTTSSTPLPRAPECFSHPWCSFFDRTAEHCVRVLACWPHEGSNCGASAPSWRGPEVIRITGTGSARDVERCFRCFSTSSLQGYRCSRVLAVLPHLLEFKIVAAIFAPSPLFFEKRGLIAALKKMSHREKKREVKGPSCPRAIRHNSTLPFCPVLPGYGSESI